MAAPRDWVQPTPSALAVGCNRATLCLGTSKQAEVRACSGHGHQWATVPMGYCRAWAILTSLKESGCKLGRAAGVPPLGCGFGSAAGPQVSAGSELCTGSSIQDNQPHGKSDGRCVGLCRMRLPAVLSGCQPPGPTQLCGYRAAGFSWVRVTGFVGGQGLFTVKTSHLLLVSFKTKPNPKHRVCACGRVCAEVPHCHFPSRWCITVFMW